MVSKTIANVSIGGWYPNGLARLQESIKKFHPQDDVIVRGWMNTYPIGSPTHEDNPYAFKCYAMYQAESDLVLWLDSACFAVQPTDHIWTIIERDGYVFQNNGSTVGEWCGDHALSPLGITREESFGIPELSGHMIGLDMRNPLAKEFMKIWISHSGTGIFRGYHTNILSGATGMNARNPGWCSDDPRVKGHRHDQTALSVVAWQLGMKIKWDRPMWSSYCSSIEKPHESTIFVSRGM